MPIEQTPTPPADQRFEGRAAFRLAVLGLLHQAATQGWRELCLGDMDFQDWPLAESECAALLNAWARPGRRLAMLARNYDEVQRNQHRFVNWRRQWAHAVECRACPAWPADQGFGLMWSPHAVLLRINPAAHLGVVSYLPTRRVAAREQWNEWWAASTPAFPAFPLGL